MAINGYVLISVPVTVQQELKTRGWVRNSVSYGVVISNAFERIDTLEAENAELKRCTNKIDDIQENITKMATSMLGEINGNK